MGPTTTTDLADHLGTKDLYKAKRWPDPNYGASTFLLPGSEAAFARREDGSR